VSFGQVGRRRELFDKIERDDPRMQTPVVTAFISGSGRGCAWDDHAAHPERDRCVACGERQPRGHPRM
jgi:hypothetical protein